MAFDGTLRSLSLAQGGLRTEAVPFHKNYCPVPDTENDSGYIAGAPVGQPGVTLMVPVMVPVFVGVK